MQQDTTLGQSTKLYTGTSSHVTEYRHSSPRIEQGNELPKEDDRANSSVFQNTASLESEMKEISLNASLESQWIPSSPISTLRSDSRAKSQSQSSTLPRKDVGQKSKTKRSQSERSQRKRKPAKRSSLGNATADVERKPSPALEDALMLPYRRTSSATFPVALDTPSSRQNNTVQTSRAQFKKADSVAANQTAQSRQTTRKTTNITKESGRAKVSEIPRVGQAFSSKNEIVSRMAEKHKVKQDKANMDDGKPLLHPVQVSWLLS